MPEQGAILGETSREEAAFWLLCALTERIVPTYFTSSLQGVLVDNQVAVTLMRHQPPLSQVLQVLERNDVDVSLFSTQWLLLGFISALPTETTLRLWDLIFVSGSRVLLAASLATMKMLTDPLLESESFEQCYSLLKSLHCPSLDCDRYIRLVLKELHHLNPQKLKQLRRDIEPQIVQQLEEQQAARKRYAALHRRDAANRAHRNHNEVQRAQTKRTRPLLRVPSVLIASVVLVIAVAFAANIPFSSPSIAAWLAGTRQVPWARTHCHLASVGKAQQRRVGLRVVGKRVRRFIVEVLS